MDISSNVLDKIGGNFLTLTLFPMGVILVFFVHELGHYLAARLFGIRIERFSIGFGRKLKEYRDDNGVLWSWNLWPLAGRVHLCRSFNERPLWQKLLVVLAGPLANMALPVVLFIIFFLWAGQPVIPPVITAVEKGQPAMKAGLRPGDEILAINNIPVIHSGQITKFTRALPPQTVKFSLRDGERVQEIQVTPALRTYTDQGGLQRQRALIGAMFRQHPIGLAAIKHVNGIPAPDKDETRRLILQFMGERVTIGIQSYDWKTYDYLIDLHPSANMHLTNPRDEYYDAFFPDKLKDNFYLPCSLRQCAGEALRQTGRLIMGLIRLPSQLFPFDSESISPEATVSDRTSYIKRNLFGVIFTIALFSVFIALLNLLPFPGLDGGTILQYTAEKIGGATLTAQERALMFGVIIMTLYIIFFAANAPDLNNYFSYKIKALREYIHKKQERAI